MMVLSEGFKYVMEEMRDQREKERANRLERGSFMLITQHVS